MRNWKPEKQSAWIRKKFGLNILGKKVMMEEEKKPEESPEEKEEAEEKSETE